MAAGGAVPSTHGGSMNGALPAACIEGTAVAWPGVLQSAAVALAAGIADGFELGDNAKAGIITRGLAEITRLGVAAGAEPTTFAGLAGTGDVMATCYSPLSRNRRTGEAIARGAAVADAIASAGGVVEGVEATAAACVLAERYGIEMPIAAGLREVLFEGAAASAVIRRLMEREATREG
jgi:glycerol-3-phosphate dehydrogenase (NAD(P)+)